MFEHGIEIFSGPPGSGKSWYLVKHALTVVCLQQRRPCYTNLPIKVRACRVWLNRQGGPEVANLINVLTEDHFRAFINRITQFDKFRQDEERKAARTRTPLSRDTIYRRFLWINGPEVTDPDAGALTEEQIIEQRSAMLEEVNSAERANLLQLRALEDIPAKWHDNEPNWIPPGASLILDELQEWFPMRNQSTEDPTFQSYLSLHRHTNHNVLIATQHPNLVSVTTRKMCERWWYVHNKRDDKLVFGLKFGHTRFLFPWWNPAFGYRLYRREDVSEGKPSQFAEPVKNFVEFPCIFTNRIFFSLYTSHTRVGSMRRQRRQVAEARAKAGLDAKGRTPKEIEMDRRSKSLTVRIIRTFARTIRRTIVLGAVLFLGLMLGRMIAPEPEIVENSTAAVEPEFGTLQFVTDTHIRVNGARYALGETGPFGTLVFTDPSVNAAAVQFSGDLWLWERAREPRNLGRADDVYQQVRSLAVSGFGPEPRSPAAEREQLGS